MDPLQRYIKSNSGKVSQMTNAEIMKRYNELKSVSGVTGILGWYVYKNMKILADAVEPYMQAHNDLVRKYGGSETEEVPKENRAAFGTESMLLLGCETDIVMDRMPRVQFEQLIRSDKTMTAETMYILDRNIAEE